MFVPGEDHSHELEQVRATIDRLRRESDAGLVVSEEDERVYLDRMRALIERRSKLEAKPVRAAGWITEETGQTYHEVWPTASAEERHKLLVDHGIKFILSSGNPLFANVFVPEDRVPPTPETLELLRRLPETGAPFPDEPPRGEPLERYGTVSVGRLQKESPQTRACRSSAFCSRPFHPTRRRPRTSCPGASSGVCGRLM